MQLQIIEATEDYSVFPAQGVGSFVRFPFFLYATGQNPDQMLKRVKASDVDVRVAGMKGGLDAVMRAWSNTSRETCR
jgi:hypothetical protein